MVSKGPHQSPLRGANFSRGEATCFFPLLLERGDREAVGEVPRIWIGMT
jgi:hypothetical protein